MKKRIVILIVGVLFFGVGLISLSFAQGMAGEMGKESMENDMPANEENMGKCPMHGMMMKKSIVVAADGGVIVLAGNKLIKYDKDLNMQKEVEIKIDMDAMQKQMMEGCPMMNYRKKDGGMYDNYNVNKAMPAQRTNRNYHNRN